MLTDDGYGSMKGSVGAISGSYKSEGSYGNVMSCDVYK